MSPKQLRYEVDEIIHSLELRKRIKEMIPQWISEGLLTQHQAETWSFEQLKELSFQAGTLDYYNSEQVRLAKAPDPSQTVTLARSRIDPNDRAIVAAEMLPLLSDLLVVVAAQQAELREPRGEVASLRDSNIAVFGEQKVLNQFREAASECEMEGFEVKMDLVEENEQSSSEHRSAEESTAQGHKLATDVSAKISGIAKYIAGLNLGGKFSLDDMNSSVRKLNEQRREKTRSRHRGTVQFKVGKVINPSAKAMAEALTEMSKAAKTPKEREAVFEMLRKMSGDKKRES
jgi:hypothetical protein